MMCLDYGTEKSKIGWAKVQDRLRNYVPTGENKESEVLWKLEFKTMVMFV